MSAIRPQVLGTFAPLSDFEIEAYLCGEADAAGVARIEAQAQNSPELRAYLAERRAEQAAFFVQQPRLPASPQNAGARRWRWPAVFATSGLALAALLVFVVPERQEEAPTFQTIRSRGAFVVRLDVRRAERVFQWAADQALMPGDAVRLTIESSTAGFVSVLGPKAAGDNLAIYYSAVPVQAGSTTLPGSLVLDAAVGDETWLVIWSAQAEPAATYVQRHAAGVDLNADVVPLTIRKLATP